MKYRERSITETGPAGIRSSPGTAKPGTGLSRCFGSDDDDDIVQFSKKTHYYVLNGNIETIYFSFIIVMQATLTILTP